MARASYELWDTESRNLVGGYASEAEALDVVRDALREHGHAAVEHLSLAREVSGRSRVIASGTELANRAASPSRPELSA